MNIEELLQRIVLTRPFVVFDLEATGVKPKFDRIVQFAAVKYMPNGQMEERNQLINPEMKIPKDAMEIHGITDEMVADKPTFQQYAPDLSSWLAGCDLSGYNCDRYDIPLLSNEFARSDIDWPEAGVHTVDIFRLEQRVNSHRLGETYKRYTGTEMVGAHDALSDVKGTITVLLHQLAANPQVPLTIAEMDKYALNDRERLDFAGKLLMIDGVACWNFGKHRGKPVSDTPGYVDWVLDADFPEQTKEVLRKLRDQSNSAQ